jgi:NADH-quinone oxidoreductase subunit D
METQETKKFIVPIGPQHPALKEPGHFEFTVDGEVVTTASARLGYVHRGIEKGTENRTWIQNLYLLERICGICSHIHGTVYAMAVEKLAGVEISPRAKANRTLISELERIHSHMLWWGVAAHEGGFDTLFMYTWRDRETVMDILEAISGNRVNYSSNLIGGVKYDITPTVVDQIKRGIDFLEERTHYYLKVITSDETFIGRTRNIGTMSKETAELLGAVGPTARASGVMRDVRVNDPYCAYPDFPVNIVTDTKGDLEARFIVRLKELFESFRIIRDILDNMPEGELSVRVPRKIPAGNVVMRVEAPRGELLYYVESDGSDKPYRVKVRTPTLPNWGSVITTSIGHNLADIPMILAGIDPCFSCNDRMVRVNQTDSTRTMSWEDLRVHGIEYYK